MNTRRIVLFAAWAIMAILIQWGQVAPHFREALDAFDGPFIITTGFWRHWAVFGGAALLVGAFWLAARASGRALVAWIGRPRGFPAPKDGCVACLVGFGFYGCLTVAFGLCGLLFRSRGLVLLAILAFMGLRGLGRAPRRAGAGSEPREVRWAKWAALASMAVIGFLALTPETWIDSLSYHLTAPQDFNKTHKWMDVHQDMYRYPLLPEGLYGQGMLLGGEPAALLLNLSGTILTVWLLWAWADRLAGRLAAWLAVLALIASDQVAFHMAQANQGMYSVGFAFLGVWAWLFTARGPASPRWALLAGIGFGWAMCAKYTAVAPVFGVVLWHLVRLPWRPGREARTLAWLGAGLLGASSPLLVNGWLFTRNPVYPLFFGGLDWTTDNTKMLHLFGCVGYDFSLSDAKAVVASIFRLLTDEQPLFLLALPVIPLLRGRLWWPFLWPWAGAFVAWSIGVPCLRLMMPAYPALALVSAVAIATWCGTNRMRRALALTGAAGILALGLIESVGAADMSKRMYAVALGLEPEEHYVARMLTTYREAVREVNRICAPSDRILVLGDSRGYGFRPLAFNRDVEDIPAMLELAREAWTPEEIGKRLRQMGVQWVLLNYVTSEYLSHYTNQVFRWRPEELQRVRVYWGECGEIVWRSARPDGINGGYVLYRLRGREGNPASLIPFLPGAEAAGIRADEEETAAYAARLERLAEFVPGVVFFEARLATALLNSGRARDAIAVAVRALPCDYPEKEVLYGVQGEAMKRLGRFSEALMAARKAEALNPREPSLVRLREECERLAGTPPHR